MLIEKELESKIVATLSAIAELSCSEIVGSRLPSATGTVKGEHETGSDALVAVAVGFRQHDNYSLTPISMPVTIAITSRAEMDATGETHEKILGVIADLLSHWHRFGNEMTTALSFGTFFAGELRMTGGSGKQFDSTRSVWIESVSFTIRGAEKFNEED